MNILSELRQKNIERQKVWEGADKVDELFRCVEFSGEAGELANAVKKLHRYKNSIQGNKDALEEDLLENLIEEMGDVLITLDLLAIEYDIDLTNSVVDKFNKTSIKHKLDVLMSTKD